MSIAQIMLWLSIFIGITIGLVLVFPMVISPAGNTSELTAPMTYASISFIFLWFCLSLYTGYKSFREILISAAIYSSLPVIGIGLGKSISPVFALLTLYWAIPVQGVHSGTESGIYLMMFIQPLIFGAGFIIGMLIFKAVKTLRNR